MARLSCQLLLVLVSVGIAASSLIPSSLSSSLSSLPTPLVYATPSNSTGALVNQTKWDPTDVTCMEQRLNKVLTNGPIILEVNGSRNEAGGTISVVVDILCSLPKSSSAFLARAGQYITCLICNEDCIYGHNKYGGSCGPSTLDPGHQTCVCADTQANATARNLTSDSAATCGVKYGNFSGNFTNDLFFTGIRARYDAVLCVPPPLYEVQSDNSSCTANNGINTSCSDECRINHAYGCGGVCTVEKPNLNPEQYKKDPRFYLTQPNATFCSCNDYASCPLNNNNNNTPTNLNNNPASSGDNYY